jgi:hypothetical protein
MSNVFDLDSLRDELDKEFAPAKFSKGGEQYTLRNLMRVGKKDRTAIIKLMNQLREVNGDEEKKADDIEDPEKIEQVQDLMAQILSMVAADNRGQALVDAVGDDLQLLSKVMELWQEATQPGEAEDSPS